MSPTGQPGTKAPHGTRSRYNNQGCRCVACRSARTAYFSVSVAFRALDTGWIAAGRRRIVARGLRADGWTFKRIAAELGVSAEQARRDCQ